MAINSNTHTTTTTKDAREVRREKENPIVDFSCLKLEFSRPLTSSDKVIHMKIEKMCQKKCIYFLGDFAHNSGLTLCVSI